MRGLPQAFPPESRRGPAGCLQKPVGPRHTTHRQQRPRPVPSRPRDMMPFRDIPAAPTPTTCNRVGGFTVAAARRASLKVRAGGAGVQQLLRPLLQEVLQNSAAQVSVISRDFAMMQHATAATPSRVSHMRMGAREHTCARVRTGVASVACCNNQYSLYISVSYKGRFCNSGCNSAEIRCCSYPALMPSGRAVAIKNARLFKGFGS